MLCLRKVDCWQMTQMTAAKNSRRKVSHPNIRVASVGRGRLVGGRQSRWGDRRMRCTGCSSLCADCALISSQHPPSTSTYGRSFGTVGLPLPQDSSSHQVEIIFWAQLSVSHLAKQREWRLLCCPGMKKEFLSDMSWVPSSPDWLP